MSWPQKEGLYNLAFVGIVTVAYILIMENIGYMVATALFVTAMFRKLSSDRWYKIVPLAILIAVSTFWMFQKFGPQLPRGILKNVYF